MTQHRENPDTATSGVVVTSDSAAPAHPTPADRAAGWTRIGRYAWATLGIVGVLVVLALALGRLMLLVVPLVLALFPAALLMPVANGLRRIKVPSSLAAILTILLTFGLIGGIGAALYPIVAAEVPDLVDSVDEGLDALDEFLAQDLLGMGVTDLEALWDRAQDALLDEEGGGATEGAVSAATMAFEGVTAFLLLVVALFFYLKDGPRLWRGVVRTMPEGWRPHANQVGGRVWYTTGAYFRGQLLVALVDAVFIGAGLLILGIPLALPLAVLIFFGGLFPIVGAVATGFVAVLVALADRGLVIALIVALLVLAVQQAEANVLEPIILSRVIRLHPMVVLSSITAGAILLGVLGAFLAVPVAASIARAVDYLRLGDEDDSKAAQAASSESEAYVEASSST